MLKVSIVKNERPYSVIAVFVILLALAFMLGIFESRRRAEKLVVTEINISYSPDLAANPWVSMPAFRAGVAGHAGDLRGSTPSLTLPDGPRVKVGPIRDAFVRLNEAGNGLRSLEIVDMSGSQAECVRRVKELAWKLRFSLDGKRTSIDEWSATQMKNHGLSRFSHGEKFGQGAGDLEVAVILEIIPVPSPDEQWMVMITVWWGD